MKHFRYLLFLFLILPGRAWTQEAAVKFLFSDATPCGAGEEVCVDVTTDDFSNVLYVKMPIKWDPKVVRFKQIKLGKLREIKLSDFNTSRALSEGLLFFTWQYDNCDKPVKPTFLFPDGDLAFSICFEAIGSYGSSSSIEITTDPAILKDTDIRPVEIFKNVGCTDVGFVQKRGTISNCVRALNLFGEAITGAKEGETVCTPIRVSGMDSIAGLQFSLQWDTTFMAFADLKLGSSTISGLTRSSFGLPSETNKFNELTFSWSSLGRPAALKDNTEVFSVCFKIQPGACQKVTSIGYGSRLEATSEARIVSPFTGQDSFRLDVIALVGEQVKITTARCDPDGLKLRVDCGPPAEIGEVRCVAVVSDQNLSGIRELKYQMTYDPEVLVFKRTEKHLNATGKLYGLYSGDFTLNPSTGVIGLSWKSTFGTRSLVKGDTLYKVCFDVFGVGSRVSPLRIINATADVFLDNNPLDYELNATNCAIDIRQPPGVSFTIGNEAGKKGETVCLPVQVTAFDAKDTLKFSLAWDPGMFRFKNLTDLKLPGMTLDSMLAGDGLLSLSWESATPSEATLGVDKAELFKACFELIGPIPFDVGEVTNCSFVEVPTTGGYSTSPRLGGRLENAVVSNYGTLCIQNPNGFVLFSGDQRPSRLSMHCVDFKARDFTVIKDFQFTLNWSPAGLVFKELRNLNPQLRMPTNALVIDSTQASLGAIGFRWQKTGGLTLPESSTLFSVCYQVLGAADTCYAITVQKAPPATVNTLSGPATLFFKPIPVCIADTLILVGKAIVNVICQNLNTGEAQVFVEGGSGTYIYQWTSLITGRSLGSSRQVKNLPPGPVQLQVIDLNKPSLRRTDTLSIGVAPNQPIANAGVDAVLRCSPRILNLTGTGTPPSATSGVIVRWKTPDGFIESNPEQSGVRVTEPGLYIFEVENNIGCIARDSVIVTSLPFYKANAGPDRTLTCASPRATIGVPIPNKGDSLIVSWNTADGALLDPGQEKLDNPTVVYGGTYLLTVRNAKNNCSSTDTVFVANNVLKPIVDAGKNPEIGCKGESVPLRATVQPHPNALDYLWETLGGGFVALGPTTAVSQLGSYTVLVRDLTSGCSTRDTVEVLPNADYARFTLTDTTAWTCLETKATLKAIFNTQRDKYTILWTARGGGVLPMGQDTVQQPKVEKTGMYTLKTTNLITGCVLTDSTLVRDIRETVQADMVAYGDTLTCREPRIRLDGIADTENKDLQFLWFLNGNQVANDTLTLEAKAGGLFTFKAVNRFSYCEGVDSVRLISQLDSPRITLLSDPAITCRFPKGNIAVSVSPQASYAYNWLTVDGVILSGLSDPGVKVGKAGTYVLQIKNLSTLCEGGIEVLVRKDTATPEAKIVFNETLLTCSRDSLELGVKTTNNQVGQDVYAWTQLGNTRFVPDSNLIFKVKVAGTYQLAATNTRTGCTATDTLRITENKRQPDAFTLLSGPITCNMPVVEISGQSGSSIGSDYQATWVPLANQVNAIQLTTDAYLVRISKPGKYALQVKDRRNGCVGISETNVPDSTQRPLVNLLSPQNLACPGKFTLINTTGTSDGPGFSYQWNTLTGKDTVTDAKLLQARVSQLGIYTLDIVNNFSGCQSKDTVVFILDPALPLADAGRDTISCGENVNLGARLALVNTGKWTVTGGPQVELPDKANSFAFGLKIGVNRFVWTISTANCANYSVDSVIITRETFPVAADDLLNIPTGIRKGVLPAVQNDQVSKLGGFKIGILAQPVKGIIDSVIAGNIHYKVKPGGSGEDNFSYRLCNNACPSLCDTAAVRVSIVFDPDAPQPTVPNTITPNGDGKNDALAFEILDEFPNEFPDAELIIFNRWGDIVFSQRPYKNDWMGVNTMNQPLPDGTYYFMLKLNIPNGKIEKGDVTIIR